MNLQECFESAVGRAGEAQMATKDACTERISDGNSLEHSLSWSRGACLEGDIYYSTAKSNRLFGSERTLLSYSFTYSFNKNTASSCEIIPCSRPYDMDFPQIFSSIAFLFIGDSVSRIKLYQLRSVKPSTKQYRKLSKSYSSFVNKITASKLLHWGQKINQKAVKKGRARRGWRRLAGELRWY